MRGEAPVHFDSEQRRWMVFDYESVQRVLSDYESFSSEFHFFSEYRDSPSGGFRPRANDPSQGVSSSLLFTNPPRHRQLRSLVSQAFTPRAVEALAPRIEELVDELLGRALTNGGMDFVRDFAYPLPAIVIAEMLGVPAKDRDDFKGWSDAVVTGDMSGSRKLAEYFARLVEWRRVEPGPDLISGLLVAQVEGEHLDMRELLGFCVLLLVAGNVTTTHLLTNAILCFDQNPEEVERLRADRDLLPGAIEEVLRYRSPTQSVIRVSARDMVLGDWHIPPRQSVTAYIGSANRDEARFEGADRFDITRSPNRHLAFGYGIHSCLGAPLARLEAKIALGAVLERLPHFRVAPEARLQPVESTIVYGVKSLPMIFS
jgi:cytochrome P450